jgi:hypothetical protein
MVRKLGSGCMHRRPFIKDARRIGFILAAVLPVISFVGVPATAQQDEAAALNRRTVIPSR